MSYTTPWYFRDPRFVSKEDKDKREAERRTNMAEALTKQTYKPKKGLFSKAVGKVTGVASDVADVAGDVGGGALSALDTWNNQVQSVPAALFTRGIVENGQYTTQRNLIGNPFANIASHVAAQREAGVLPEDKGLGILGDIEQGFAAARRSGQAFQEDPDIPEGVKFATGVGLDPTTYIGAGAISRAARATPVVGKVAKAPGLSGKFLRGAASVAEGFENPAQALKFTAGGAVGSEIAARKDIPYVPETVERLGLPLLTGGAAVSAIPGARAAGRGIEQLDQAINEPAGVTSGEPVAAGMVREDPRIQELQAELDDFRSGLDTPQGWSNVPSDQIPDALEELEYLKSQIEQLGGRDRGFPSRFELQQRIGEIRKAYGAIVTDAKLPESAKAEIDDLTETIVNYDRLKTLHEGTTTEAPGYAELEAQGQLPDEVANVMSLEEAQNLSNLSDIPDDRLVRLIEDARRKNALLPETGSQGLNAAGRADVMRRISQLANYEDEARKRGLNIAEELRRSKQVPLHSQEPPARAFYEPEVKATPAQSSTGLTDVPIEQLQQNLANLDQSGFDEATKDFLRRNIEQELRARSIGGGTSVPSLVEPKPVTKGLTRGQEIGNYVTEAKRKLFGHGIKSHEIATPIADEYARQNRVLRRQAERIHKIGVTLEQEIRPDSAGLITDLNGVKVETTIQDIARNFSQYKDIFTPDQVELFDTLRRSMDSYYQTLEQYGVAPPKLDIKDPQGFYLPRDKTVLGEEILPELQPRGVPLGGGKKGFEKAQRFPTMVEGIKAGYQYPQFSEALQNYGIDVANRASETWLANKIKEVAPKTPRGQTGQVRLYQTSGLKAIELPSEISDVINRELSSIKGINRGEFDQLYTSINNTMRAIWAAGDASRIGIQSLLFGMDNPKVAGKSLKAYYKTLYDPGAAGKFIQQFDDVAYIENRPLSTNWIKSGLEISRASGEGTDIGGLAGSIEKLPGFGTALKATSRLFSEGGNIDRLSMADMLYRQYTDGGIPFISNIAVPETATKEQVLASIATAVNRSTGYAEKSLGGDIGQALLFAPRFFQSQLETIFKASHGRGIENQVARRQLIKTISLGTAITFAINEARGKETVIDPRDSNFLRIRDIGGADISIFGPWDSLTRAFIQSTPHIDQNGDFTLGDPTYLLRTKLSPVLSTALSIVTGKTFTGESIKNPETLFRQLMIPFAFREAGKEPATATVFGLAGIKTSPLTNREKLENMIRNDGADPNDPIQKREWLAANTDRIPKSEFGPYKRSQTIQDNIRSQKAANEEDLTSGKLTLTQFRDNRTKILQEQRDRLDELGIRTRKPRNKQERWLNSYFKIFDESKGANGLLDSTKFDNNLASWTTKNGQEALDYMQEYLGTGKTGPEAQYYQDMQTLQKSGYFDLPKYHGMHSGLSDEEIDSLAQQVTSARIADPRLQNESFASTARRVLRGIPFSELRDIINSQKKAYSNPEREVLKARFGKELLWFNQNADWNAYENYQGQIRPSFR